MQTGMQNQGRPTRPTPAANDAPSGGAPDTSTGARALEQDEPLIFELDTPGARGVDLPPAPEAPNRLGDPARDRAIGLPDPPEPTVVRPHPRPSPAGHAGSTSSTKRPHRKRADAERASKRHHHDRSGAGVEKGNDSLRSRRGR